MEVEGEDDEQEFADVELLIAILTTNYYLGYLEPKRPPLRDQIRQLTRSNPFRNQSLLSSLKTR